MSTVESTEWPRARLGDLIEAKYGKGLSQKKRRGGDVPVFGANGVVGFHDEAVSKGPTIVIGRKGSAGAVNLSEVPCWPIDTTYYIDDPGPFSIEFLELLLRSLQLGQHDRSTAIPGLSRDDLYDIKVPVPSDEAQDNLVGLVGASRAFSALASEHIQSGRTAVDRLRRAVLTAGCSGRLTTDWRKAHDCSVAPDLVSTAEPGWLGAHALPETWVIARIADIGAVQLGGTPARNSPEFWDGGVPWVSSGEVANCRITTTRETISDLGLEGSSAKLYPPGTVLIAMIGEGKTRGQAAILDIEASTNQNAAGIIAQRRFVDPEYLWRWALAQYETTRAAGTGGNQPALNKERVANLIIPVPPLEEQGAIVRRVDELLGAVAELRSRVEAASQSVGRADQALLAKAFRGELSVP